MPTGSTQSVLRFSGFKPSKGKSETVRKIPMIRRKIPMITKRLTGSVVTWTMLKKSPFRIRIAEPLSPSQNTFQGKNITKNRLATDRRFHKGMKMTRGSKTPTIGPEA
jgi:hypothetical protein